MCNRIFSVDCETDGLWGQAFWVAAIVYEKGQEVDKINLAIANPKIENEWVCMNVLPQLDVAEGVDFVENFDYLCKKFADFYMGHKATTLWHMGHIVEANFFRQLQEKGCIGEWDAPYTPIEVSTLLAYAGERPDSVDEYTYIHELECRDYGGTHNPS